MFWRELDGPLGMEKEWNSDGIYGSVRLITYNHNKLINLCVADFLDKNGNWNWQLFAHLLPNHIILKITAIKAPCANSGEV